MVDQLNVETKGNEVLFDKESIFASIADARKSEVSIAQSVTAEEEKISKLKSFNEKISRTFINNS